jgi:DNA-binding MarR family transcriptional regulator
MSEIVRLDDVLHQWAEVFMRRNMREFRRMIEASDLSPTQMIALFRLHYRKSSSVSEIASHLGVSIAAASQLIERLVQSGLVERSENPADRREKLLVLSPKGREMMAHNISMHREWIAGLVDQLLPSQQDQITSSLRMLIQAAQNTEPDDSGIPAREPERQVQSG